MNETQTSRLKVIKLKTNTASQGRVFLCECECGRQRKVPEARLAEVTCCVECEARQVTAGMDVRMKVGDFASEYIKRWGHYLARFTEEQRALFDEIMCGRERTERNLAEAVDVVMREPLAAS